MKHARIFCRIAEVALDLIKVLGGNWSAIISLAAGLVELYEAVRREPGMVWAL